MTQILSSTGIGGTFQHIRLADVSGDGYADVLVASHGGNEGYVLINNGSGGFGTAVALPGVNDAWDVYAADIDGDGHVDVGVSGGMCQTSMTNGAYWFKNNGSTPTPGWSDAKPIALSTPPSFNAQRMSLGDINNDGYVDAVVLWFQVRVKERVNVCVLRVVTITVLASRIFQPFYPRSA